jgi:hypothetical protein
VTDWNPHRFGPRFRPNKVTHFDDGTSVIALAQKDGSVLPCYIDTADYDLVKGYRWRAYPSNKTFYAMTHVYVGGVRTTVRMHQLLMPLSDGRTCDHRNRHGLDCRKNNLRPANASQQNANRRRPSNNMLGHKGVIRLREGRAFRAYVSKSGKQIVVGEFTRLDDAVAARGSAAKESYGEFAI